jgi:hypothetical protein
VGAGQKAEAPEAAAARRATAEEENFMVNLQGRHFVQ